MMEEANAMFKEVTDHIATRKLEEEKGRRRKYSGHSIHQVEEDEERALDVARSLYQVVSPFALSGLLTFSYSNISFFHFIAFQDDLIPRVSRNVLTRLPGHDQQPSCVAWPRHP